MIKCKKSLVVSLIFFIFPGCMPCAFAQQPDTIEQQVTAWVSDAHQLAMNTGYAHLVAGVHHKPISATKLAGPAGLQDCSLNGFQDKIAKKKVQISQTYVDSAGPVVEVQLEKAGLRLAALLDALWTSVGQ